jgi:hypothetical protein
MPTALVTFVPLDADPVRATVEVCAGLDGCGALVLKDQKENHERFHVEVHQR